MGGKGQVERECVCGGGGDLPSVGLCSLEGHGHCPVYHLIYIRIC
jgi:hypothetical protein